MTIILHKYKNSINKYCPQKKKLCEVNNKRNKFNWKPIEIK